MRTSLFVIFLAFISSAIFAQQNNTTLLWRTMMQRADSTLAYNLSSMNNQLL